MARIRQIGIGRKSSGTIDGITYVTRKGVTYARSTPTMPASAYTTEAARKRQTIFRFIQMHIKYHLRTIRQTFTPVGNGSAGNRYISLNYKPLSLALGSLAEQYLQGQDVTITEIEAAISAYAAEHPTAIRIASLSGYQEVYLTGAWPDTITLNASVGDSTVIIIVAENGTTTTINADGSTTVGTGSGSSSSNTGSSDNAGGSDNSGDGGDSGNGNGDGGNNGDGDGMQI